MVALLLGCSSQNRDQLVRVFFTGVDEPVRVARGSSGTNSASGSSTNSTVALAQGGVPVQPVVFFHKPFAERNCVACHVLAQSAQLKAVGGDLCLTCHDKLIGKAKFVHSPVDDGKCQLCHDPHQSKEKWLLIRKGRAICLDCHRLAKMEKVKGHVNMGSDACQSCHDPHRSDLKKLLKASTS